MMRNPVCILPCLIVLLTVFFSPKGFAGDSGGSGYSRYGIGDLSYFLTNRAVGMGGAGFAVLTNNEIDEMNPAAWARITRTRFSASTLYEGFSTSDNSKSAYLSQLDFNGVSIAIPVATGSGVVISAGFTPYSRVDYNVITPIAESDYSYTVQYVGSGGLSLAYLGSSWTIDNELNIGAKLNYFFGTLNYATTQSFNTAAYANDGIIRSTELRGIGFSFGAIYTGLRKILQLPDASTFNLGALFTTTSYLNETDERFYAYNSSGAITGDTVTLPGTKTKIPFSTGGGLSFSNDRFLIAADIFYQHWSAFQDVNGATIRDDHRYSIGAELTPKRVAYRLGFFYNETYYQLHGIDINETGITAGLGLPVIGDSRLNFGMEYSWRGTTDNQLQRDKIVRVTITLTGGETWFIRPEQE